MMSTFPRCAILFPPVRGFILALFGLCLSAEPSSGQAFTKITDLSIGGIITHNQQSMGAAWIDYDKDGHLDLMVTNINSQVNRLYHNNGDGTFTHVEGQDIVTDLAKSNASTWGDFDNDGDLDPFIVNSDTTNSLYYNNGDGTFTPFDSTSIIVADPGSWNGGSWADYDGDGDIDLFRAGLGGSNALYRNEGALSGFAFTKVLTGPVVGEGGDTGDSAMGAWGDYDNDGDLDLFVSNGFSAGQPNFLYENNGDGTFTKVASGPIATDSFTSLGGSWGDYDNDGDLDVFVTNAGTTNEKNSLYRNDGGGTFVAITTGDIVNDDGHSLGSCWGDYNNDGDLDLFVTNAINQLNFLYQNNGDGTFTKITGEDVVTDNSHSFGCAWGDYDNDGFIDLIVANGGIHSRRTNLLYKNNGNSNNWIQWLCVGNGANGSSRDAIGTKVRVKTAAGWQMREVTSQSGFASQSSMIVQFGLGTAVSVDSLVFEWPSGAVDTYTDLPLEELNQLHLAEEGVRFNGDPPGTGVAEGTGLASAGIQLAQNLPNPFGAATSIGYSLPLGTHVTLGIYTVQGREVVRLVDGHKPSGPHTVVWNGTDARGNTVSSGVYFYRLTAKDALSDATVTGAKRLVLLR